jgi:membrane protein implicated in regulation of membrane protease activity
MTQIVFWLILLVVLVAVEAVTLGLTTIWFAGGALVAMLAAMIGAPLPVQVVLFFIVSLVMVIFTRPVAVKYFNRDRVRTNAESLVGRQAVVISEIDNLRAVGQVSVNGQEWSARSWEENGTFPVGAVVRVASINGVKLIVREIPTAEREAAQQETAEMESIQQEAVEGESIQQEAVERESIQQEAAEHESIQQEIAERESIQQEAAEMESIQQEAAERESILQETVEAESVQ